MVVKIMIPFRVPIIVRHLIFRVPKVWVYGCGGVQLSHSFLDMVV